MSELKAYCPYANRDGFYHKSDVDKLIADLEKSHKMEVGRLRAELEYSTFKRDYAKVIAEKDAEIRRLNDALDKERSETIKYMDELCNAKNEIERLTIDKRNAELRADIADATAEKLKAENECLKQKLEDVQASAYAESVDAGMRERRLNRVLWLARANTARQKHDYFALYNNNSQYLRLNINGGYSPDEEGMVMMHTAVEWCMIWKKVATKCHAMAERYGEVK